MSDWLGISLRVQANLTDGKRLAELEKPAYANNGRLGGWLAQEVDVQAGRDRERDDPDLSEDGDVERYVGDRHEHGTRYCSTGSQLGDSDFMPDCGAAIADCFDGAPVVWELPREERGDFG